VKGIALETTGIDFWVCGAEKCRTGFAFWRYYCNASVMNADSSEVYGLATYHWSIPRIDRKTLLYAPYVFRLGKTKQLIGKGIKCQFHKLKRTNA
jgi:hypothetical protein